MLFDAEHFFDGYKRNPEFALRVLEAAAEQGASTLVLCDTNGGSLPYEVEQIVREVVAHFRDDVDRSASTCTTTPAAAWPTRWPACAAGARQVQGTINGYGERTGNCNLTTIIPNLTLKMGVAHAARGTGWSGSPRSPTTSPSSSTSRRTRRRPTSASSAFAHKAGLHVSRHRRAPRRVRARRPRHASATAPASSCPSWPGKATLEIKAEELGLDLDGKALGDVVDQLKRLEHEGYHFEAADGSLELLMRRAAGWEQQFFELESFRVIADELPSGAFTTEATVKVHVGGERVIATAEGNGPVNALDHALRARDRRRATRSSTACTSPTTRCACSTPHKGTGAVTRVLIDSTDGDRSWSTIGVSENIIEASWQALFDSIVYGLLHTTA